MNDIAVIHLVKGGFTVVDVDALPLVSNRRWYMGGNGYVTTCEYDKATKKTKHVYLHRALNNTPKGMDTDHRNGIPIDNTSRNLRSATRGQNIANCMFNQPRKTSSFKGVSWRPYKTGRGAWIAHIKIDYKVVHLGSFASEIEAARAYNTAAVERFGEFCKLNDLLNSSQKTEPVK